MNRILIALTVASLFSTLSIGCASQTDEPEEESKPETATAAKEPASDKTPEPAASEEVAPEERPEPICVPIVGGKEICCTAKSCVTY